MRAPNIPITTTALTYLLAATITQQQCCFAIERTITLEDGSERIIEYYNMDLPIVSLPRADENGIRYTRTGSTKSTIRSDAIRSSKADNFIPITTKKTTNIIENNEVLIKAEQQQAGQLETKQALYADNQQPQPEVDETKDVITHGEQKNIVENKGLNSGIADDFGSAHLNANNIAMMSRKHEGEEEESSAAREHDKIDTNPLAATATAAITDSDEYSVVVTSENDDIPDSSSIVTTGAEIKTETETAQEKRSEDASSVGDMEIEEELSLSSSYSSAADDDDETEREIEMGVHRQSNELMTDNEYNNNDDLGKSDHRTAHAATTTTTADVEDLNIVIAEEDADAAADGGTLVSSSSSSNNNDSIEKEKMMMTTTENSNDGEAELPNNGAPFIGGDDEDPEIISALEESLLVLDEHDEYEQDQVVPMDDVVTAVADHDNYEHVIDEQATSTSAIGDSKQQSVVVNVNNTMSEENEEIEVGEGAHLLPNNNNEEKDVAEIQEKQRERNDAVISDDAQIKIPSTEEEVDDDDSIKTKPNESDVFPNNLHLNPKRTSPIFDNNANQGFVEGLDDFGKFMESVDPPDELDVGASGSSIQEVLMQQGTRIVIKRIQMGVNKVRMTFSAVRRGVQDKLSSVATNQKDHIDFALVVVDKTQQRVSKVTKTLREIYDRVLEELKERFDIDFTSSDDDDDDDFQIQDMKSMFQQQQMSGTRQSGGQGLGDSEVRFSNDGARSIEELRALIEQQKGKSLSEEA